VDLIALLLLLTPALVLSAWASWLVARDDLSGWGQKAAQWLLVWLLPLIGAVIVWGVHRRQEKSPLGYRSRPDAGEDIGCEWRRVGRIRDASDGDD
jgi:hypothetical protein